MVAEVYTSHIGRSVYRYHSSGGSKAILRLYPLNKNKVLLHGISQSIYTILTS